MLEEGMLKEQQVFVEGNKLAFLGTASDVSMDSLEKSPVAVKSAPQREIKPRGKDLNIVNVLMLIKAIDEFTQGQCVDRDK